MIKDKINKVPIIEILPTFLLRGIEPQKIINKYLEGGYSEINKNTIEKKKINTQNIETLQLLPQYDKTHESEIYTYVDKSNVTRIVGTTNHAAYLIVKNSDGKELPYGNGRKCDWCHLELKAPPIGIPIKFEWIEDKNTYIFHTDENLYDTFECCFSGLKRLTPPYFTYRDPLRMDSEQMLRFMYSVMYPKEKKLKEAPDWKLLKENGGFVSQKDFFDGLHEYKRTPNIILLPAKVEYICNIKNN